MVSEGSGGIPSVRSAQIVVENRNVYSRIDTLNKPTTSSCFIPAAVRVNVKQLQAYKTNCYENAQIENYFLTFCKNLKYDEIS